MCFCTALREWPLLTIARSYSYRRVILARLTARLDLPPIEDNEDSLACDAPETRDAQFSARQHSTKALLVSELAFTAHLIE